MADIVHLYWRACRMLGTHEKFVRDPWHKITTIFSPLSSCKNFSCVPKIEAYITRLLRLLPSPSFNLGPRYRTVNVNACYFSSRELLARLGIAPYWTNAKAGPVTLSSLPLTIVKHKRLVRLLPFPLRELLARPRYRALFNISACYAFLPSPPSNFSRVPVSRPTEQMRKGLSRFLVQCTSHAFNCCQKNILLLLFYSWIRGTHKTWQLRRTKNRVIATTTNMKMKEKMQR